MDGAIAKLSKLGLPTRMILPINSTIVPESMDFVKPIRSEETVIIFFLANLCSLLISKQHVPLAAAGKHILSY
ncbi:MAG: hypothetical protein ACYCZO_03005 [Daejeonella sp.]